MSELGPLVAQYGPFRVHERPPHISATGRVIRAGYYWIAIRADATGEFIIAPTRGLTSDREAVIARLNAWVHGERHRLAIRRQDLAWKRTPDGLRDLQDAMDEYRREYGDEEGAPRTAAEMNASIEQEIELLQARFELVERSLREFDMQDSPEGT